MVMRTSLLHKIGCLILLAAFSQASLCADIIARTDRANIGVNESFTLIFESSGSIDGEPDFTPLHKDFDILNTNQSSNVSIVNGNMTRTQSWVLHLFPKRAGTIAIPEISFGRDKSPALEITVSKQAGRNDNTGRDIFIEAGVEPQSAYVQQQLVYTVKLYRAVVTNNASLTEPEIDSADAVLLKLGDDRSYDTVIDGRHYSVFERRYVLFPQKAGKLSIPAVQFTGSISTARQGLFDFDTFGRGGQLLRERSDPVNIDVKPIPGEFKGRHWLPAESLQLSESWSPDPPVFTVGEPVTRSITLTATGLAAAQLPELNMRIPAELKQYPDQPALQDANDNRGAVGTRIEKLALIPTRPGRFTLPAIEIPWWNTRTEKQEVARLPDRVIDVAAAATDSSASRPETIESVDEIDADTLSVKPASSNPFWRWFSVLLGTGWLVTLIAWWYSVTHRRSAARRAGNPEKKPDPSIALQRLRIACRDNDAQAAKQALLQWAQARWPERGLHNLNAVAGQTGAELAAQIHRLSGHLYRDSGNSTWRGNDLWLAVKALQPQDTTNGSAKKTALQPLHRIRTD